MSEPKTPQQWNEAVARKLGLGFDYGHNGTILTTDYERGQRTFSPATDPAAALWALERWCDEHGCVAHLIRSSVSKNWSCRFHGESPHKAYATIQEAIYKAIVGAAE